MVKSSIVGVRVAFKPEFLTAIKVIRTSFFFRLLVLLTMMNSSTPATADDPTKEVMKGKFEVQLITKASVIDSTSPRARALLSIDKDGKMRDEHSTIMTDAAIRSYVSTKKGETPFKRRIIIEINDMDIPFSQLTKQIGLMREAADPNSDILIEVHCPPKMIP